MVINKATLKILRYTFSVVLFSYALVSFAKGPPSPANIKGTQKITAETVIQHVEKIPGLVIIDSRITSDRHLGYIEGSLSLPDSETSCTTLSAILPNKTTPAIFYCNGPKCGRSAVAVKIAIQCGYSHTYWFRGGFEEWKQKKYPSLTD